MVDELESIRLIGKRVDILSLLLVLLPKLDYLNKILN